MNGRGVLIAADGGGSGLLPFGIRSLRSHLEHRAKRVVVTVSVHSLLLLLISTEEGVHLLLLLLLLLCLISQFLLLLLLLLIVVLMVVVVLEKVTQLTGQHLIAAATTATAAHLILTVAHCFGEKLLRLLLQLRKAVVV